MRVRRWDTIWTRELTCHLTDKQLIHGQIGPTMRVYCAQHHMKNSEGFSPSQNVFYFRLPKLWRGNHELTIKDYLRLLLHCHQNTPPQPKFGQNQENAMLLEKNATPTNLWAKRKHNVGTCHGLHMCRSDILLDRNLPPCSQTVANATNAKTVKQQPYREPTCHERTQKH